ncbi:MAG: AarF/UbiB family protein, partial [Myxococcota bacterium]
PEEVFAHFEREPLAAASIAQVHRARLDDGTEVVAKVLRPNIVRSIRTDLDIVRFLTRQIEKQFPDLELLHLGGMIADFEKSILEEVDLSREAVNTERFGRNLADLPGVRVPRVYRAYSSREVLCMDFLDGVKMRDARAEGFNMERIGGIYFQAAARMLFEDGFFHGDLHPGNVLVIRGDDEEDKDGVVLGLLDFGMVGTLTDEVRDNICAVLFATSRMDFRTVARVMFEVGIKTSRVNYPQFEGEVMELMQRHVSGRSMSEIQIGAFLSDLLQGCLRYRIRVPPGYTMLFKAIMTSEGLAKDLIPELDPLEQFQPVLERAVRDRFSLERLSRDASVYLMSADYLLKRAPIIGAQMISDYETGRLSLPITHENTSDVERRSDARLNRVVGAVVMAALLLASVLSMNMPQILLGGIPLVTLFLYGLTGLTGGWLLWSVMRSGGLSYDTGQGD